MREIFFRGKRTDNGEWVYGAYSHHNSLNRGFIVNVGIDKYSPISWVCEVIPETVGQYTGLTDKNGTKIFEGDIVAWNNGQMDIDGKYFDDELFLVKFSSRTFGFVKNYGTKYLEETLEGDTGKDLTVIGHIYDNPELLKGGDEE